MNRLDTAYLHKYDIPEGYEICPDCNGHGWIDTGASTPNGEWITVGCGCCDGMGIVKVES